MIVVLSRLLKVVIISMVVAVLEGLVRANNNDLNDFKLFVCLLKKCLIVPFKPGSLEEISNDFDKFLTSIIFFTI